MKKNAKRAQTLLVRILSLAIGGALLILVFRGVDLSITFSLIANAGYYFIPIFAVYGIGCLFDTTAWKLILDTSSKKIPFGKLLQVHIAGESMYRFIPAGVVVGEATKTFLLMKQSPFSSPEILSSLVIRKLLMGLSQGFYIGSGVLCGILLAQHIGFMPLVSLGASSLIFVLFISMGFMLSRGTLFSWIFRLLKIIPFVKTKVENQKNFFERTGIELKNFFIHKKTRSVLASLPFFGGWLMELLETSGMEII